MGDDKTKEPQYQGHVELRDTKGFARFGLRSNATWHEDPRRLLFVLARYKFVSKMLSGKKRVLEVGCGDAFGTRLLLQEVESVTATDFDPVFLADARERMDERWAFDLVEHDMLSGPLAGGFDGAYALDVIEHIPAAAEDLFVANIAASLTPPGVLIVGTPSLESQEHACEDSKKGHVNCKDAAGLKALMLRHFEEVFIFSMNDEVVHTGFYPMAHYLLALCVGARGRADD